MSHSPALHRESGFTLIELMIVVIILGVVVALAAPSFNYIIKTNSLRTETHKFVSALNLAKSEAVKRNVGVVICNSADCTGNLQDGWTLFFDTDGDGALDSGETIRVSEGLSSGYTISNSTGSTIFSGAITFQPDGSAAPAQMFLICPPDKDSNAAWGVTLNTVGSPSIKSGGAGTCPT